MSNDVLSLPPEKILEHIRNNLEQIKQYNLEFTANCNQTFDANIKVIKQHLPSLLNALNGINVNSQISLFCLTAGQPNIMIGSPNNFFYPHTEPLLFCQSDINNLIESNKASLSVHNAFPNHINELHVRYHNEVVERNSLAFGIDKEAEVKNTLPIAYMFGYGLGYHLASFLDKVECKHIVVFEPMLDFLYQSLYVIDYAKLVQKLEQKHCKLTFISQSKEEDLMAVLNKFFVENGRYLANFFWSCYVYHHPVIDQIAQCLQKNFSKFKLNTSYLDDAVFALSQSINNLKNGILAPIQNFKVSNDINQIPVFVVGNGPSLSDDIPFLRKVQDKAIIFACGSAFEPLYNSGIAPHFVVAQERLKSVAEYFDYIKDKSFLKNTVLITTDVSHPSVYKYFDKAITFARPGEVSYQQYTKLLPKVVENWSAPEFTGPLSANFGANVARVLGFKNIFFFGVDNGSRDITTGQSHSEESSFYNLACIRRDYYDLNPHLSERKKANFEETGEVLVQQIYNISARMLEADIAQGLKEGVVYVNCSDGVYMEGAIPMRSSTLDMIDKLQDFDVAKVMSEVVEKGCAHKQITEEEVKSLFNVEQYKTLIDSLVHLAMQAQQDKTRLDVLDSIQNMNDFISEQMQANPHQLANVIYGSFSILMGLNISALAATKNDEKAVATGIANIKSFINLAQDSLLYVENIPEVFCEDHGKFLNNKVGLDHVGSQAPDFRPFMQFKHNEETNKVMPEKFTKRYE